MVRLLALFDRVGGEWGVHLVDRACTPTNVTGFAGLQWLSSCSCVGQIQAISHAGPKRKSANSSGCAPWFVTLTMTGIPVVRTGSPPLTSSGAACGSLPHQRRGVQCQLIRFPAAIRPRRFAQPVRPRACPVRQFNAAAFQNCRLPHSGLRVGLRCCCKPGTNRDRRPRTGPPPPRRRWKPPAGAPAGPGLAIAE